MATTTNEVDLIVKYAGKKAGSEDGQLVIDDVELNESRDNRVRHGIGNDEPQSIEKGNKTYSFSVTNFFNEQAADALKGIDEGQYDTDVIYIRAGASLGGQADTLVFNDLTMSASDGGDVTASIEADLLSVDWGTGSGEGDGTVN